MRNPELVDVAALLLRLSLAVMFFAHAWLKIKVFTIPGTVKYFESLGVPGFFAYLTIAAEISGSSACLCSRPWATGRRHWGRWSASICKRRILYSSGRRSLHCG
jgi:hypothetical protein